MAWDQLWPLLSVLRLITGSRYHVLTWDVCWFVWLCYQALQICRQKLLSICCPDLFFVNSGIGDLDSNAKLGGSGRASSLLGCLIPRTMWWNKCTRLGALCKSPNLPGLWENQESAPEIFPSFPLCLCPQLAWALTECSISNKAYVLSLTETVSLSQ